MEKIIIHSHIGNLSYAFTVAELAYREFSRSDERKKTYFYPDGIKAIALKRDKGVTIIVDYADDITKFYTELTEVKNDDEF